MKWLCRFKHKWRFTVWYFKNQAHLVRFCKRCRVLEELLDWELKGGRYVPIYKRDSHETALKQLERVVGKRKK